MLRLLLEKKIFLKSSRLTRHFSICLYALTLVRPYDELKMQNVGKVQLSLKDKARLFDIFTGTAVYFWFILRSAF